MLDEKLEEGGHGKGTFKPREKTQEKGQRIDLEGNPMTEDGEGTEKFLKQRTLLFNTSNDIF